MDSGNRTLVVGTGPLKRSNDLASNSGVHSADHKVADTPQIDFEMVKWTTYYLFVLGRARKVIPGDERAGGGGSATSRTTHAFELSETSSITYNNEWGKCISVSERVALSHPGF